ncbi:MAG: L,D-transpeptidase [Pseudomonadota bacterium]
MSGKLSGLLALMTALVVTLPLLAAGAERHSGGGPSNKGSAEGRTTKPITEAADAQEVRPPVLASIESRRDPAEDAAKYEYIEIEVSHSRHELRLLGHGTAERQDVLYETRVGLGSPGFPTPVGVYFVTHIFDDDPWWIPPSNRAWAAGQSPSRKVYGGVMAPLLKKRPVKQKKKGEPAVSDYVADPVRLDDYGYRFHGTNQPRSIGRNQSHGCVRMIPDDAKKLAALIKQHVGVAERRDSENGNYCTLRAAVRLNLIK